MRMYFELLYQLLLFELRREQGKDAPSERSQMKKSLVKARNVLYHFFIKRSRTILNGVKRY